MGTAAHFLGIELMSSSSQHKSLDNIDRGSISSHNYAHIASPQQAPGAWGQSAAIAAADGPALAEP